MSQSDIQKLDDGIDNLNEMIKNEQLEELQAAALEFKKVQSNISRTMVLSTDKEADEADE